MTLPLPSDLARHLVGGQVGEKMGRGRLAQIRFAQVLNLKLKDLPRLIGSED